MWVPPPWLIYSLAYGHMARRRIDERVVEAQGQTIKEVRCEACERCYTYELKRFGFGTDSTRAAEDLKEKLDVGFEVIPCPDCGWYQANMLPEMRRRHRRWMVHLGQCLTVGLVPVAVLGTVIYAGFADQEIEPTIPWPVFVAGLVCVFAAGIYLLIRRYKLAQRYDPNEEAKEARKR
jgi:hypothetical protein